MTRVLSPEFIDSDGQELRVGDWIIAPEFSDDEPAQIHALSSADGDTDDEGRMVGIPARIFFAWPDGDEEDVRETCSGPWDDWHFEVRKVAAP